MPKLSPQQEKILAIHRDGNWHCSTEYEFIRDHRKRISELNEGYLKSRGFTLNGKPCDGRCGKNHSSGLYMRKAVRLSEKTPEQLALDSIVWFDRLPA